MGGQGEGGCFEMGQGGAHSVGWRGEKGQPAQRQGRGHNLKDDADNYQTLMHTISTIEWTSLLTEPKAVLGPYGGSPPPLSTFAPHAWRAQFDQLAIPGQFTQLPVNEPTSWGEPGNARADVVFEFSCTRLLRVDGFLKASESDDSLHGAPCGLPGDCSLIALPDFYLFDEERSIAIPWKRFEFQQSNFSIVLEAGHVRAYCGQRAVGQFNR